MVGACGSGRDWIWMVFSLSVNDTAPFDSDLAQPSGTLMVTSPAGGVKRTKTWLSGMSPGGLNSFTSPPVDEPEELDPQPASTDTAAATIRVARTGTRLRVWVPLNGRAAISCLLGCRRPASTALAVSRLRSPEDLLSWSRSESAQRVEQVLDRVLLGGWVLGLPDRGEHGVVLAVDVRPGLAVERLELGLVVVPGLLVGVGRTVQAGLVAAGQADHHVVREDPELRDIGLREV